MNDPDTMGNNDILLRDNMTESLLLKHQISSQHSCTLVVVIVLFILYYVQNKYFNIV